MTLPKLIKAYRDFFVFDLSWHLYRSYHSFRELSVTTRKGIKPTGHIYGVIKSIMDVRNKYPDSVIFLCKDGNPIHRKEENPDYKGNRQKTGYDLYQDVDDIVQLAYAFPNVYKVYHPNYEADDIMYSLAKQIERENPEAITYIFSGDDDLLQALSDRVFLFRRFKRGELDLINETFFKENKTMYKKYRACPIEKLSIFRSIVGDSSDNIKGLERMPKELAKRISEKCEGIEDIDKVDIPDLTEAKKRHLERVREEVDLIKSNHRIMELKEVPLELERKLDKERLKRLISVYELNSLKHYLFKKSMSRIN